MDALTADAALMPVLAAWAPQADGEVARQQKIALMRRAYQEAVSQGALPKPYDDPRSAFFSAPAQLFNAMIAPLTRSRSAA